MEKVLDSNNEHIQEESIFRNPVDIIEDLMTAKVISKMWIDVDTGLVYIHNEQ